MTSNKAPRQWVRGTCFFAMVLWAVLAPLHAAAAGRPMRPLSVEDAMQTSRLQGGSEYNDASHVWQISPDGRRFVTLRLRGDTVCNCVRMTMLIGSLDPLQRASRIEPVVTFSASGLYDPTDVLHTAIMQPSWSKMYWLDNRRIVLFWEDRRGLNQVYVVDVDRKQIRQLTRHPTNLNTFVIAVSAWGDVLYSAYPGRSSADRALARAMLHEGFAVQNDDAYTALRGAIEQKNVWYLSATSWYLKRAGRKPVLVKLNGQAVVPSETFVAKFSPDAQFAILEGPAVGVRRDWLAYSDPWTHRMVAEALQLPGGFDARQLHQLYLLDTRTLVTHPFIDAPLSNSTDGDIAWSPDGRSVIIGRATLPTSGADADGLAGRAVAEIAIKTGRVIPLPIAIAPSDAVPDCIHWFGRDLVSVETKNGLHFFRRAGSAWVPAPGINRSEQLPRIELEIRQGLNEPPKLYAKDRRKGEERLLLDPNPGLQSRFELGHVEKISWKGPDGFEWSGLLYFPVNYRPGQRYPLVVQTHGLAKGFSLYGMAGAGLATEFGPFAAQVLAGKGIAVLQVQDRSVQRPSQEAETYMRGYEAGVEMLATRGIINPERVGIEGFSRTGWYVDYIISHSSFPYIAALSADRISGSYVESTLAPPGVMYLENGGKPFGSGLSKWLENAPDFSADRVRTPLLMQMYTGPVDMLLSYWELFTRLRQLDKPVELFVIPDVEHGGHNLQNPRQLLAAKGTAVDWFDFWLNGHEDSDAAKRDQYARWEKLCDAQRSEVPSRPAFCVPSKLN